MGDFSDEMVEILEHIDKDVEKRNPDQESDESEDMFGNEEYQKRQEYRELHIGGDDLRIKVVGFYRMYEGDHTENRHDNAHSAIIIPDDESGDRREERSEDRNESEDEDDDPERDDIWKRLSSMEKTDDQ